MSRFNEVASVLVRFDQIASGIVNANDGTMRPTEKLHVLNRVIRLGVLQAAERQRIQEQIKAALSLRQGNLVKNVRRNRR